MESAQDSAGLTAVESRMLKILQRHDLQFTSELADALQVDKKVFSQPSSEEWLALRGFVDHGLVAAAAMHVRARNGEVHPLSNGPPSTVLALRKGAASTAAIGAPSPDRLRALIGSYAASALDGKRVHTTVLNQVLSLQHFLYSTGVAGVLCSFDSHSERHSIRWGITPYVGAFAPCPRPARLALAFERYYRTFLPESSVRAHPHGGGRARCVDITYHNGIERNAAAGERIHLDGRGVHVEVLPGSRVLPRDDGTGHPSNQPLIDIELFPGEIASEFNDRRRG